MIRREPAATTAANRDPLSPQHYPHPRPTLVGTTTRPWPHPRLARSPARAVPGCRLMPPANREASLAAVVAAPAAPTARRPKPGCLAPARAGVRPATIGYAQWRLRGRSASPVVPASGRGRRPAPIRTVRARRCRRLRSACPPSAPLAPVQAADSSADRAPVAR